MAFLPSSRPYTPADHVANACLSLYHPLDAKYKPRVRSNGLREWTVLAGIVLSTKGKGKATSEDDDSYTCVSLTSGVKVLSGRALPVFGDALHDSHAEILARRGFLVFLINETRKVLFGEPSAWVEREGISATVRLRQGINVHLYVSTLPCGDASTLYTALSQPADMASLKAGDNAAGVALPDQASSTARGRSGYGVYGSLRTKPGRADSIPSTSHSCSDKIATWSVLGLQGALLVPLFPTPIYLSSIVIGDIPRSPPDEVDMARCDVREAGWQDIMRTECERAFSGRLASIESLLPRPHRLHRPRVNFTALCFPYGRWQVAPTCIDSPYPPAPAVTDMRGILYVPGYMSVPEPINNGCKGNAVCKLDRTEPVQPRYRSSACRLELFRAVEDLVKGFQPQAERPATYHDSKHGASASTYQQAKTILRTDTGPDTTPPFQGWLISGERWETFDYQGSCS